MALEDAWVLARCLATQEPAAALAAYQAARAPRARLRLDAREVHPGEALLAFGNGLPTSAEKARKILNLSERGDLTEAASRLYAYLRELDASGAEAIAVVPIPGEGLGEAIRDRLARAAAPK